MTSTRRSSRRRWGFALGVLAASCLISVRGAAPQTPPPASPSNPQRLAEMEHHFTQVTRIQEAITRGDLAAVLRPAIELANIDPPSGTGPDAGLFVTRIRTAARRAAKATTLADAAGAAAAMLNECGGCHRTAGVRPTPTLREKPNVGGLVGHMLEHQAAADNLLQGLIIPSESQWARGAEGLLAAPLKADSLPSDPKLTADIVRAERTVHDLALTADRAESPSARATAYANLLTTCATCHSLHRRVWGPGQR